MNKINKSLHLLLWFLLLIFILRGFNHRFWIDNKEKIELDFSFNDRTKEIGLEFSHNQEDVPKAVKKLSPWLTSQGANVSIVDINNDGYQDIFLTSTKQYDKSKLYINQKNGKFIDEAAKFGLDNLNTDSVVFRSLFFDSDNDGIQELFLLSYPCPKLFKQNNKSKKYELIKLTTSAISCTPSIGATVIDINNDSLLDIVYAGTLGSGFSDSANLPMGFVQAQNGGETIVMLNKGNNNFEESNAIERQNKKLFTNAIGVGDYRNTNNLDIWYATDFHHDEVYGKENNFYKNLKMIDYPFSKSGMSVEHVYLGEDYFPYIFVSHVFKDGYMPFGNTLYHFDGKLFEDTAVKFGNNICGWSWGTKFFDINNDGYKDQYVANGFFSAKDKNSKKEYWYFLGVVAGTSGNLIVDPKNWPDMTDFNFAGNEQDCLYLNKENKKFIDISSNDESTVDREKLNGRSVATIDINNNGSIGLVVTNQKDKTIYYQSIQKNKNNWVGIKLVGTKSNRDAIGSKVILSLKNNKNQISDVVPFNGYSAQSDSRLHFGLGSYEGDINVTIIWPSGSRQDVKKLTINSYNLILEN